MSDELRAALRECVDTMKFAEVFVNSRERIKQPEGREMYAAAIKQGEAALAALENDDD